MLWNAASNTEQKRRSWTGALQSESKATLTHLKAKALFLSVKQEGMCWWAGYRRGRLLGALRKCSENYSLGQGAYKDTSMSAWEITSLIPGHLGEVNKAGRAFFSAGKCWPCPIDPQNWETKCSPLNSEKQLGGRVRRMVGEKKQKTLVGGSMLSFNNQHCNSSKPWHFQSIFICFSHLVTLSHPVKLESSTFY